MKSFADLPDWLRVSDVAAYTGLSAKAIYAAIADGRQRHARYGRSYRIHREWASDCLILGGDQHDKD